MAGAGLCPRTTTAWPSDCQQINTLNSHSDYNVSFRVLWFVSAGQLPRSFNSQLSHTSLQLGPLSPSLLVIFPLKGAVKPKLRQ